MPVIHTYSRQLKQQWWLFLLSAGLAQPLQANAQKAARYAFVGIQEMAVKKPCGNKVGVGTEMTFIKYGDTYESQNRLLIQTLKDKLGEGNYYKVEFPVSEATDYYIAKVQVKLICPDDKPIQVQYLKFCGGKTKADVEAQMERDRMNTANVISYTIVEEVNWREKLAEWKKKTDK